MREMKDSGIEWLGEIDKEFNVAPLKFFLEKGKDSIKTGPFGSQLSGSDFLSEPSDYWVYNQRSVIDNNFRDGLAFISQEKFESMIGFQVSSNDILITTRGTIGKINRIPEKFNKGIIHPCIIKFRINEELINYKLLRYIFNESDFISRQIHYKSNATTIDVIYSDTLKNILIPICDLKRQNIICTKLETICLKIDTLIANQQSQIEKLKSYKQSLITEVVTKGLDKNVHMKDSGVEWIGEIPNHWQITKIKFILDKSEFGIKCGPFGSALTGKVISDGDIRIYGQWNIISEDFSIKRNTITVDNYDELSSYQVKPNDVLVSMMGTIGRCIVAPLDIPIGIMDSHVIKIRLDSTIVDSNFFKFQYDKTYSYIIYEYFNRKKKGFIMDGLNTTIVKNAFFILPSLEEQKNILEYLENKCTQIDSLISLKQQKIEKLQQYKKSLIYEYVTGKKEVK